MVFSPQSWEYLLLFLEILTYLFPCNSCNFEELYLWYILSLNSPENFRKPGVHRRSWEESSVWLVRTKMGQWSRVLGSTKNLRCLTVSVSCGHTVKCQQSTWNLAEGAPRKLSFVSLRFSNSWVYTVTPQPTITSLRPILVKALHLLLCSACVHVCLHVCVCQLPGTQNHSLGPNHWAAEPLDGLLWRSVQTSGQSSCLWVTMGCGASNPFTVDLGQRRKRAAFRFHDRKEDFFCRALIAPVGNAF